MQKTEAAIGTLLQVQILMLQNVSCQECFTHFILGDHVMKFDVPPAAILKKGPKLPGRGSQLSVGMADAAFVADNHGAWLKFAPCSMSDEQWEVAAKTPEAVLSHRSCPWGGHLIKIDSKTLDTSRYCECTKQCCSVIFYVSFCDVSLT